MHRKRGHPQRAGHGAHHQVLALHLHAGCVLTHLFCTLKGLVQGSPGHQQDEFFSSITAGHVFVAHTLAQQASKFFQDGVSCFVAVGVIEVFEVVEVQHDQPDFGVVPLGASHFAFKGFFQITAVEQSGQDISDGLFFQAVPQSDVHEGQSHRF